MGIYLFLNWKKWRNICYYVTIQDWLIFPSFCGRDESVCVCVSVYKWEREREKILEENNFLINPDVNISEFHMRSPMKSF